MHGRRLATTESIIAVTSPGSDEELGRLDDWTADRDVELSVVDVGDDIEDVYDEERQTLGVTFGGDGTFLEGIRTFAPKGVPLFGVNTGTLAFLARVAPADLDEVLTEIYQGRASVDNRQQLRVTGQGLDATGVNDVMIQRVPPDNPVDRKITRLDVFVDDEFVGTYEGTGIAVATPTGSTGVSLSAGGPIQHPQNNHTLQIVGLQTHQIGSRPLVLSASSEITVVPEEAANLLVDGGRAYTTITPDDAVTISGSERPAHIVNTSYGDEFMTAISAKLGWGLRGAEQSPSRPETASTTRRRGGEREGDQLDRAVRVAREAAEAAGEPLRDLHGDVESIEYKSDKADIVTEADYQADRIITTTIANEFPDHGIRSEESEAQPGESRYTWLIDPLDGTGNFANGNPNYAVSIALLEADDPVVGVVYAPETNETFSAIAGETAYENDTPITTTDREHLDESMLLSGYDPDGTFLSHFYQETRGVRRFGSAALHLCYLASSSADAVWEYDTYPWDVAAGLVVARAAGATITDATGDPYELRFDAEDERTELLGSNGPLHPALLSHLETEEEGLQPPESSSATEER